MGNFPCQSRDEIELVLDARRGDLGAFDELVARYRSGAKVAACHIVGSKELAEDAVQDSFLAAYKALPQLVDPELFAGWFGAIVRNRSRRLLSGQRHVNLPLDALILTHAPSITRELEKRARSDAVRCAVAGLAEEIRPVIDLYYLQEWQAVQIAEFLGLPLTTVKWRLHVGRKQLRAILSEELEELDESTE